MRVPLPLLLPALLPPAHRGLTLRATTWVAGISLVFVSSGVQAQEFSLFGGASQMRSTHTYTWALNYQEGLGPYFAASFSWLNEGHVPNHHRDGQLLQLWGRLPVGSPQFVVQAGVGPYRYFDTTTPRDAPAGEYSNIHGWGVVYSVRAAYYASSRWVAQLQLNRVHVQRGPDASSVMVGIGYQLDAPGTPGPRDWASSSTQKVTNNEVAVYLGDTIVNSTGSPSALSGALEYRRGLMKYLDVTLGYLHEGNHAVARRDGLTSQLWATRAFFDDRFTLGLGVGAYYALRENENGDDNSSGMRKLSGLVTMAASYRLGEHWDARVEWNRVVTRYDRDSDVIFAGLGYRF
ncbi:porin family protein [Paraburkholderia sp. BCC1886]|uniref:porin family protein n=1 Tax=Paraburkholderia sp. BCC1886 TaxID=2562670 RepID=UPI0021B24E82|nr:porin family protein [Paraburkholderia sp. BCC1886]